MGLLERVRDDCKRFDLIREGDRILAGVSGGADSVCLFLLLCALREELKLTLSVVHVEHGIRGASSEADAEFVKGLCESYQVPCVVRHVDVPAYAAKERLSLEEAARDLRYRTFYEELKRLEISECAEIEPNRSNNPCIRLAVAHNKDDQAETVLFHLIRGSSISGLIGMKKAQNSLIRPLLNISRGEILNYLREQNQEFCEDETNADPAYARNRLRADVLPVLTELNSGAVSHIAQAADELAEVDELLSDLTKRAIELTVDRSDRFLLKKEPFDTLPDLLKRRVLYEALAEVGGSKKDISREHLAALFDLMRKQSGRQLTLPYDVIAQRTYQGIRLVKLHTGAKRELESRKKEDLNELIQTRIFPAHEGLEIPKKKFTKWLDYDKIENTLQVRTRRSGDYLVVDDAGAKKSLKKYLIDEKIPGEERAYLPLVCDGSHVVWVVGHRISAYYKVTAETKRVIEILYIGGLEE